MATTNAQPQAAAQPKIIGNFVLGDVLGSGVSGSTYVATNIYNGHVVALKVQHANVSCPTNPQERRIYRALQGGTGIPTLWASNVVNGNDYLAIDLLGDSLDGMQRKNEKKPFDLRTTCTVAIQLLSRLEFMHSRGILHRDIQLGNMAVGLDDKDKLLYMIDFGFAKEYVNPHTGQHLPNTRQKYFTGNYWFSSINVHCRQQAHGRRDDLEAAALMLIHMLTPGGLPWTRNGVPKTDYYHSKLKKQKREARPEDLCRDMPEEFENFLRYCRALSFTGNPDYSYWRNQFRDLAFHLGFENIDQFVWPPPAVATQKPIPVLQALQAQPLPPLMPVQPLQPPQQQPARRQSDQMAQVLQDLANMRMSNRPVLGDKKNIPQAPRSDGANGNGKSAEVVAPKKPPPQQQVIIISSDSEENAPAVVGARTRFSKAADLCRLTNAVSKAIDNKALASIVAEYAALLQGHTSRTLTKEGFAFLDALHKQLADPSVFMVPLRTSRTRGAGSGAGAAADPENAPAPQPQLWEKRNKLWALRVGVSKARDNRTLAALVADFGKLTDKSSGRKLTKDGFAFLEGLAEQLKVVQ
ncbi:kinase-like protein [Dentipellis sp. KUC8613]|nr:kinase-like protein [Dentipellis sp. KUC8613]